MKLHKQYRLRTIRQGDEIRWTVEMNREFIEPVKDEMIYYPWKSGTASLIEIVTSGTHYNFSLLELGNILHQIENCIRRDGLRKER